MALETSPQAEGSAEGMASATAGPAPAEIAAWTKEYVVTLPGVEDMPVANDEMFGVPMAPSELPTGGNEGYGSDVSLEELAARTVNEMDVAGLKKFLERLKENAERSRYLVPDELTERPGTEILELCARLVQILIEAQRTQNALTVAEVLSQLTSVQELVRAQLAHNDVRSNELKTQLAERFASVHAPSEGTAELPVLSEAPLAAEQGAPRVLEGEYLPRGDVPVLSDQAQVPTLEGESLVPGNVSTVGPRAGTGV